MRMFCFHHAGGGALIFKAWQKALAPTVEVVPVEVPNRERFATMGDLVDEVIDQLGPLLDEPHMFFGHSFGAMLAYRLACVRAATGAVAPRAIFLSAYAPRQLPLHVVEELNDKQLAEFLAEMGLMPAGLTRWPALQEQALIVTRHDLRLLMTADQETAPELSCPIHVFGGSEDPIVKETDLHEWRSRTNADFSVQILRGGHFYLRDRKPLFETLRPLMSSVLAA